MRQGPLYVEACYAPGMDGDTLTIIGTVLAVGFGLATLIMRSTARLDADRREVQRRFDDAMADFRRQSETWRSDFRTEMQRLAERQSHVEGRLDERGSAAD